jgi:hypothetical protein
MPRPAAISSFRPPAVPLAVVDPYFSVWSFQDRLTDGQTRHWTGAHQPLSGLLRVDGKAYRFLGSSPKLLPAMTQVSREVHPTRTICRFQARGVQLTVTFLTPAIPQDLTVFSWPVTYVDFELASVDGEPHRAALYFDASAQLAVDQETQAVNWGRVRLDGLDVQFAGTTGQHVLEASGDDRRIDWGYLHLAVPKSADARTAIRSLDAGQKAFAAGKTLPDEDAINFPHVVANLWPKLTCVFENLAVPADESSPLSRFVLLAYDDVFSLEYNHRKQRPYWRRPALDNGALLTAAAAEHDQLARRCAEFDAALTADLTRVGGKPYAELCALSFRQCCAAHKLAADFDGTPIYFSKENYSNGCINTVDVTYPSAPFFLLLNPVLLRAQIEPICAYARSPRWKFPFAPHDLGTYPHANGQVYGGGELTEDDQMPVEECGNMLLLAGALVHWQDDNDFARKNLDVLRRWAEYLRDAGFNPKKQLCTDDFAGRLAHNTNLSIKTILALGAYAQLCDRLDLRKEAAGFWQTARDMAARWVTEADDGDHYRLAFDRPGTWSLKYNLVWDRLLGLNLFPAGVVRKEMAFYHSKMQRYGLPLDNRKSYGKLDWSAWVAALAETREESDFFIEPLHRWAHESRSRVPLTDWYWTSTGAQTCYGQGAYGPKGFQARSVVGGLLIRMLFDPAAAAKWREIAGKAARPSPAAGLVPAEGKARPIPDGSTDAG